MRQRSIVLCLALVLVTPAPPSVAQADPARAALESWIEQINTGTDDRLESYITSSFSTAFLRQVPLDQMLGLHRQLMGVKPLAIKSIESDTGSELVAIVSSTGGPEFRIQLNATGDPPLISGMLVQPLEPQSEAQAQPLEWNTLDELAGALADRRDIPGIAIAWARPGEEPRVGAAGLRAADGAALVRANDRFHIGSITKSMTASALGALVEDGVLSWDATLAELLPGVEMNDAYTGQPLRLLVRHRARIPQHLTMDDAEMARLNALPGTPTEQRGLYVGEVLLEEPLDSNFHYSNAGYALAAYIGEQASGRSWAQLISEEVFAPLGLSGCGIGWPATPDDPEQPRGHSGSGEERTVQALDTYELGAFIEPAGDVHCSATDLARYGLAHLAGLTGRDGFLKAATVQELHHVYDEGAPYAAGWGVDPVSGQHRHNGSAGTFFSYLVIDPAAELVAVFLANAGPGTAQAASVQAVEEMLARAAAR